MYPKLSELGIATLQIDSLQSKERICQVVIRIKLKYEIPKLFLDFRLFSYQNVLYDVAHLSGAPSRGKGAQRTNGAEA